LIILLYYNFTGTIKLGRVTFKAKLDKQHVNS
jgi:hypothetical protein